MLRRASLCHVVQMKRKKTTSTTTTTTALCKFSFRPTKRSQELRQIKCDYPIFMVIRQEREVIIKIVYWVKARARQKNGVKKIMFWLSLNYLEEFFFIDSRVFVGVYMLHQSIFAMVTIYCTIVKIQRRILCAAYISIWS